MLLRQHQRRSDQEWLPAEIPGKSRRQAPLAIQSGQQVLQVIDPRLHLHDEDGAGRRLPAKYVDRAAFTSQIEGLLWERMPAHCCQAGHHLADDDRVLLAEQLRKLGAPPSWGDRQGYAHSRRHSPDEV